MSDYTIPPGVAAYNGTLAPVPSFWRTQQPAPNLPRAQGETDQALLLSFDWTSGTSRQVDIGQQQTSTPFSTVQALYVNNIKCAVDIDIIFPDTGFVLTVPGKSAGLYPVTAIAPNFYVIASGALAGDFTRITAFNYLPPPVAIAETQVLNIAAVGSISGAAGTTAILGNTVNGTISAASIQWGGGLAGAGAANILATLQDGESAPLVIGRGNVVIQNAASSPPAIVYQLPPGGNVRFASGLNLVVTNSGTAIANGSFSVNVYYR